MIPREGKSDVCLAGWCPAIRSHGNGRAGKLGGLGWSERASFRGLTARNNWLRSARTKGGKRISRMDRHAPPDRGHQQRVNEQIRISPVRLIGAAGEQLGVVPTAQALDMAR